uniref:Uncharacterized protein n=1 Tax=Siphoviridae sp. ctvok7 TaxID=2827596 RepID=A0A8S5LLR6_9CAUD|nr:MAG TPA: hypothetical protein [Siphoviridae sp. ctvok7]
MIFALIQIFTVLTAGERLKLYFQKVTKKMKVWRLTMKFKDPATGEVFHTIRQAVQNHCSFHCNDRVCPYWERAGCVGMLKRYTVDNPHEAARLMGYEVVEDCTETQEGARAHSQNPCDFCQRGKGRGLSYYFECGDCGKNRIFDRFKPKEANMDKPLKDWTLGELKTECEAHNGCVGCHFEGSAFCTQKCTELCPSKWDLSEKPRFTEQEVEDAKTIKRMFGADNFTHIHKDEDGWPEMMDGPGEDGNVGWCSIGMEEGMFPSLRPNETVTLDEIIGGAE